MYKQNNDGLNKPREGQIGRARPTSIKVARGVQAPQLYKAPRIREATSPPFTNLLQQRCSSSANRNHKIEDATAGAAPEGPRKVLETMRGIQLQTLNQEHSAKVSGGSALGSQKRPRHRHKKLALATSVQLGLPAEPGNVKKKQTTRATDPHVGVRHFSRKEPVPSSFKGIDGDLPGPARSVHEVVVATNVPQRGLNDFGHRRLVLKAPKDESRSIKRHLVLGRDRPKSRGGDLTRT